jgi:hypothetical protein
VCGHYLVTGERVKIRKVVLSNVRLHPRHILHQAVCHIQQIIDSALNDVQV